LPGAAHREVADLIDVVAQRLRDAHLQPEAPLALVDLADPAAAETSMASSASRTEMP
jgi:hypothetical protein